MRFFTTLLLGLGAFGFLATGACTAIYTNRDPTGWGIGAGVMLFITAVYSSVTPPEDYRPVTHQPAEDE